MPHFIRNIISLLLVVVSFFIFLNLRCFAAYCWSDYSGISGSITYPASSVHKKPGDTVPCTVTKEDIDLYVDTSIAETYYPEDSFKAPEWSVETGIGSTINPSTGVYTAGNTEPSSPLWGEDTVKVLVDDIPDPKSPYGPGERNDSSVQFTRLIWVRFPYYLYYNLH